MESRTVGHNLEDVLDRDEFFSLENPSNAFRDAKSKKPRKRTIANLSKLPSEQVDSDSRSKTAGLELRLGTMSMCMVTIYSIKDYITRVICVITWLQNAGKVRISIVVTPCN